MKPLSRRALLSGVWVPREPPLVREAAVEVPDAIASRAAAFRAEIAEVAQRSAASAGPKLAVLAERLCLLALRTECSVCLEACPEPGAIAIDSRSVRIDPRRCTGCGQCVARCPAPIPALALRPVRS